MNLVLDDAEELSIKKKTRKALGRILLKGDSITLMMSTCVWPPLGLLNAPSGACALERRHAHWSSVVRIGAAPCALERRLRHVALVPCARAVAPSVVAECPSSRARRGRLPSLTNRTF